MPEAEAAFKKALSLDDPKNPGVHAIRVLAQMKQGLGDHWAAIRALTKAIELDNNPERIQCLFLRGGSLLHLCYDSLLLPSKQQAKLMSAMKQSCLLYTDSSVLHLLTAVLSSVNQHGQVPIGSCLPDTLDESCLQATVMLDTAVMLWRNNDLSLNAAATQHDPGLYATPELNCLQLE